MGSGWGKAEGEAMLMTRPGFRSQQLIVFGNSWYYYHQFLLPIIPIPSNNLSTYNNSIISPSISSLSTQLQPHCCPHIKLSSEYSFYSYTRSVQRKSLRKNSKIHWMYKVDTKHRETHQMSKTLQCSSSISFISTQNSISLFLFLFSSSNKLILNFQSICLS